MRHRHATGQENSQLQTGEGEALDVTCSSAQGHVCGECEGVEALMNDPIDSVDWSTRVETLESDVDWSQFFHAYATRERDGEILWQSDTAWCGYKPTPGVARNPKPPEPLCCPICNALLNNPNLLRKELE